MITLDQIKKLDARVKAAIERISALKEENAQLKARLSEYEKRIEELEVHVNRFKKDQGEIEAGIINVLAKLDSLEDEITEADSSRPPTRDQVESPEENDESLDSHAPKAGKEQLDIF